MNPEMITAAAAMIPSVDPLGYPLPPIFLLALAYLTLTLHFLAVQFTLGGAAALIVCQTRKAPGHEPLVKYLGTGLPLGVSYLVTLGIPPLLFVQLLYGNFFYTSSVLMAGHWIQVIFLLIIMYLSFYANKILRDSRPGLQVWLVLLSLVVALHIGFIYANNLTLMMQPEKFFALYTATPDGFTFNVGEITVWPRWALVVLPSFCVAGVVMSMLGAYHRRRGNVKTADLAQGHSWKLYLAGLVLGVGAALALWVRLPEPVVAMIRSTMWVQGLVWGALLFGILGVVMLFAFRQVQTVWAGALVGVTHLLAVACLVIVRDMIRLEYLRPFFTLDSVPINPQWKMFIAFAVGLVAALALLFVVLVKVIKQKPA
jgi:hypothetical protein